MSNIHATKHLDTRAHIPSKEEEGYEAGSEQVQDNKEKAYERPAHWTRDRSPELIWKDKFGNDDREQLLRVDIRSLYRHEHISPEVIIQRLFDERALTGKQLAINELFGNALERDELEKPKTYYQHPPDQWTNRLIQGDSLLIMASLLEREGMAGKVQMIYLDPPYGIKYGSNWQIRLNNRDVKDGLDESLSGEPEQIKAFRDTWELGIHSYLSYLRDRLLVAKELLTESGSCFVQISDENVHLVRNIMDEVFGSENFMSVINVRKTGNKGAASLDSVFDYIVWYGKNKEAAQKKYNQLLNNKEFGVGKGSGERYDQIELADGTRRAISSEEKNNPKMINKHLEEGAKIYQLTALISESSSPSTTFEVEFHGKKYFRTNWKTTRDGLNNLIQKGRVVSTGSTLRYVRYLNDFPAYPITNYWDDTGVADKLYTVQTSSKVLQRCILMSTDPGDLVLDPTCGSGTTAYVAEQWGRRWITTDTSRIALNIAKTRLMTAIFPYYKLHDEQTHDIRQGFQYKKVPHITLKSLANDEPAEQETLYDQPFSDNTRLRVAGPFTVETLQSYEPVAPEELDAHRHDPEDRFEERLFEHLKSAGIKNGDKQDQAVFTRIDTLVSEHLHAEGFYPVPEGNRKAYIHLGPKYGTVSKKAVTEAIIECRHRGDADWLVILGFSFESDIEGRQVTTSLGGFRVDKVRINDDLMQEGLLKKDKKAASFVTIGEPDIKLHQLPPVTNGKPQNPRVQVEICGLDIYDPIRDRVNARSVADIAYWMLDDDYDGSNFIVRQVFFCGGDHDEFNKFKKGLNQLAKASTKRKAEQTLKIEIDDEAFNRLYGYQSHPIEIKRPSQKIAVRVISQFGEESTKVFVGK